MLNLPLGFESTLSENHCLEPGLEANPKLARHNCRNRVRSDSTHCYILTFIFFLSYMGV